MILFEVDCAVVVESFNLGGSQGVVVEAEVIKLAIKGIAGGCALIGAKI